MASSRRRAFESVGGRSRGACCARRRHSPFSIQGHADEGQSLPMPPGQSGRPDLDCLEPSLFRCQTPDFWGLEKLGFPWILSSEYNDINELQWIFAERNFARPFALTPEVRERRPVVWHGDGTDCSSGEHNYISDFLQDFAARPASSPPSKSNSPKATPSRRLRAPCARGGRALAVAGKKMRL
jgi:hypothetical protein